MDLGQAGAVNWASPHSFPTGWPTLENNGLLNHVWTINVTSIKVLMTACSYRAPVSRNPLDSARSFITRLFVTWLAVFRTPVVTDEIVVDRNTLDCASANSFTTGFAALWRK